MPRHLSSGSGASKHALAGGRALAGIPRAPWDRSSTPSRTAGRSPARGSSRERAPPERTSRRQTPPCESARRCRSTSTSPRRTRGRRPVLRRLRQAAAGRPVRLGPGLRRRAQGQDDDRPRPPAASRAHGDLQGASRTVPGRGRRRASAGTRATAACWRWSAATTTTRASSTSPSRASGSRARPSSRSSLRPPAGASRRQDGLRVPAADNLLGDRYWAVHNFEGANLGPIDLTTATIHSDNTVYAQLTQLRAAEGGRQGPRTTRHHEPAEELLRDRARRRGGQPARDGARVRLAFANGGPAGSTARLQGTGRAPCSPSTGTEPPRRQRADQRSCPPTDAAI